MPRTKLKPRDSALTPRENDVLEAARWFWSAKGYSPTSRELGKRIGITGQRVGTLLRILEAKGRITRTPGVARSIRVL